MADKAIVLDLDETLGCFVQFAAITNTLAPMTQSTFNALLDIFPEFMRAGIFDVLNYVADQKRRGVCTHVVLYTNNQAPREWAMCIVAYIHYKLGDYALFDKVVGAFKVGRKRVEMYRTSHDKMYTDLLRCCTALTTETDICFIDDCMHPLMLNTRVMYLKVSPYVHYLPADVIVERLDACLEKFSQYKGLLLCELANCGCDVQENSPDNYCEIAKALLKELECFFAATPACTPPASARRDEEEDIVLFKQRVV